METMESLNIEDKRMILEELRKRMVLEIYRNCVLLGIDYDTFDYASYEQESPVIHHESVVLKNSCVSYANILEQIESLN